MGRRRFVILVADSAGCGALPDAAAYGDEGSNTIGNVSRAVGGLALPVMGRMGLGRLTPILGVPPEPAPVALHGRMAERSPGKDTITGHWEMMGVVLREPLSTFPRGFPPEIVDAFVAATGVPGILANRAASGPEIHRAAAAAQQAFAAWLTNHAWPADLGLPCASRRPACCRARPATSASGDASPCTAALSGAPASASSRNCARARTPCAPDRPSGTRRRGCS